jgi:hypothetical protein
MQDNDTGGINDTPNESGGEQYQDRIERLRDIANKLERVERHTSPDDVRINLYDDRDQLTLVFQRGEDDA